MTSRPRSTSLALMAIVAEGFLSRLSFGVIGFALPLINKALMLRQLCAQSLSLVIVGSSGIVQ